MSVASLEGELPSFSRTWYRRGFSRDAIDLFRNVKIRPLSATMDVGLIGWFTRVINPIRVAKIGSTISPGFSRSKWSRGAPPYNRSRDAIDRVWKVKIRPFSATMEVGLIGWFTRVIYPIRVATIGSTISPGVFAIYAISGSTHPGNRSRHAIDRVVKGQNTTFFRDRGSRTDSMIYWSDLFPPCSNNRNDYIPWGFRNLRDLWRHPPDNHSRYIVEGHMASFE